MNPYRDRFFTEDGTHTTVPGAIPKAQRAYTTAPVSPSSTKQILYPHRSPTEDGVPQDNEQQRQRQRDSDGVDDDNGDDDGDDEFGYDGRPPWKQANRIMRVEEEGRATRKRTGKRDMHRRSLQDSDAEPAVESPLTCVSQGDSVLFDISSGCYPVYQKDSLLNSNLE